MIGVIGASFTAEYFVKGLYETTIGRVTAWLASDGEWRANTREDRFIQQVAQEYSTFIHATPWYEFPFGTKLKELWSLAGPAEGSVLRQWERTFEFTMELLFKSAWSSILKQGTQAGYDAEAVEIQAWVRHPRGLAELSAIDPSVKVRAPLGQDSYLVSLPRYEPFKDAVQALIQHGTRLVEVAGNEHILLTLIVPHDWHDRLHRGVTICEWSLLTKANHKRVAMLVPIGRLHELLAYFTREGLALDHLYDF